jgi:hypothetical protein
VTGAETGVGAGAGAGAERGAPHWLQNRVPGGEAAPHFGHVSMADAAGAAIYGLRGGGEEFVGGGAV